MKPEQVEPTVDERDKGPVTAAEVVIYDDEALSARHTSRALVSASRRGLCFYDGRMCWWPTGAYDIRGALEDRFLRDTRRDDDG